MKNHSKKPPTVENQQLRTFDFPITVHAQTAFRSVSQVRQALVREITNRELRGFRREPFRFRHFPTMGQYHYIYVYCRTCKGRFKLIKKDGQLIVANMELKHYHPETVDEGPLQTPSSEQEPAKPQGTQKEPSTTLVKHQHEEPKRPPILPFQQHSVKLEHHWQRPHPRQLAEQQPEQDLRRFASLESFMERNRYDWQTVWGAQPQDRYPQLLVVMTPAMHEHSSAFGDLVHFEILYDRLRMTAYSGASYNIGVFIVEDTGRRPLIAGLAVYTSEKTQMFTELFRRYLVMQRKRPLTILTCDRPAVCQAMELLRIDGGFEGYHLLNPYSVLMDNQSRIGGGALQRVNFVEGIKRVAEERDIDAYREQGEVLLQDSTNKRLFEELIRDKPTMFYCGSGDAYVGLGGGRSVAWMFHQEFPKRVDVEELVCSIERLSRRSWEDGAMFAQTNNPIVEELQLADPRLAEVLQHCETEVSRRFVENYLKGSQQFVLDSQYSQEGNLVFRVRSLSRPKSFHIVGWQCECNELGKTGVGCAHVILAAMVTQDKPYIELISPRWQRLIGQQIQGNE